MDIASVTAVVPGQGDGAFAFVFIEVAIASEVARQNPEVLNGAGFDVNALVDVDGVGDGYIVGIKRGTEAEALAVETIVVAVPIDPVAGVGGGQRNRERAAKSREPTPATEADLAEASAVNAVADCAAKTPLVPRTPL